MRQMLLIFLLCGAFAARAVEFVSLDMSRPILVGQGKLQNNRVICTADSAHSAGLNGVIFPLDLTPWRNCVLTFEVKGKADGLSRPEQHYFGHKFMLLYTTVNGKKVWAENNGGYGSFDRLLTFNHTVASDAGKGELRFCIQNVAGRMEYDLSSLKITVNFRKINGDLVCEYSDTVRSRPVHRGVMSPIVDQDNEEHFKKLREWNVNLLRLQLNTSDAWARKEPKKYAAFIEEKIDKTIPRVLDLAQKYGIKVIIDLHTVPGTAVMYGPGTAIFNDELAVSQFIAIWERIAAKFKNHPALYGYDLINEPKQNGPVKCDYWQLQKKAAEAIRRIDSETPIYVTANQHSSQYAFSYLSPLKLKNIIYEVHCYEPFVYTHTPYLKVDQSAGKPHPAYPGVFYGYRWDRDGLRSRLQAVIDFQRQHQAKIYVGEFSVRASSPGGEQLLADYIAIFEENGWDWTYHAFNEARIWDLEFAGPTDDSLTLSPNNPRKRVVLDALSKNTHLKKK